MRKFIWLNIKFENLVRAVIVICTFIAIVIICIAFYFVFNSKKVEEKIINLEDFSNITSFEATYDVTVYSNKNINKYSILESADFLKDIYNIKVENGIEISSIGNNYIVKNENTNYSYEYSLVDNYLNAISLSYIIKNFNLNYLRREIENDIIFEVEINNILYKYYDIYISRIDKKITKICMYNNDGILQILIDNIIFEVKK